MSGYMHDTPDAAGAPAYAGRNGAGVSRATSPQTRAACRRWRSGASVRDASRRSLGGRLAFALLLLLAHAGLGCGGGPPRDSSRIDGSIDVATFPAPAFQVRFSDGYRRDVTAELDEAGRFGVRLRSGAHYRVFVDTADGPVRVLFPRRSGRADGAFSLATAAAVVSFGSIRYLDGTTASVSVTSAVGESSRDDGRACLDGVFAESSLPCTVESNVTRCESGGESTARPACDVSLVYCDEATCPNARGPFAYPSRTPPCEIAACDALTWPSDD